MKINTLSKKLVVIILFFFFFFGFIYPISAITLPYLNKSKVRVSVVPGQQEYGDIVIENSTPDERAMQLYLEDWRYLPICDGSKDFLPANTLANSAASWITFSPAEFIVPAFGRQRISYSIKAPANASGGYYAVLFFEMIAGKIPAPDKNQTSASVNLAIRIASLFYVEADGTIKRTAVIDNIAFKKDDAGAFSIQADFANTGNVDITAGGTFHIMDKEGLIYARGEFSNAYSFAGDKGKLVATWKNKIPKGRYDLILTVDLGKALEEANLGRGPVVTREFEIEINEKGEIVEFKNSA